MICRKVADFLGSSSSMKTSTIEQVAGLEAQIRDLKAAGAEKLFSENVSSVTPRQQLGALGPPFVRNH